MTFSITGRCRRTGMVGVAIATSSIAVGARCPHVRAGVGAVASQNVTNPALGPGILARLAAGASAASALSAALAADPGREFRQVVVVPLEGPAAVHSGPRALGRFAHAVGRDCAAAGNLLSNGDVPGAMVEAFGQAGEGPLAERLLRALSAGLAAGGEEGPVHSAALLVARREPFPFADLRVDWHESEPVAALGALWEAYAPQAEDYVLRARAPDRAPGFGVPGDDG